MASSSKATPVKRKRGASAGAPGSSSAPIKGPRSRRGKLEVGVSFPGLQEEEEGVIFVCGEGDTGQLGLGEDIPEAARPKLLPDVTGYHVAAGSMHSIVVSSNRKNVITFGCSDDGTLGRATSSSSDGNNSAPPENLPGSVNLGKHEEQVAMVTAGDCHTAVLTKSGHVYVWGIFRDSQGTFGLVEAFKAEGAPVKVANVGKAIKIASGANHVVILEDTGSIVTFGCAEQGQLGRVTQRSCTRDRRNGVEDLLQPSEATVGRPHSKDQKVANVWAGGYGTYVNKHLSKDVLVCGLNNYCQLGINIPQSSNENTCLFKLTPAPSLRRNWKKIVSSEHHAVLLSDNGQVYTLGRKEYGRLGLGENCPDATEPTLVPSLKEVVCIDIACGSTCSFALAENGSVYSWGMQGPQLGLGSIEEDQYIPIEIPSKFFKGYIPSEIAAGSQHLIVLAKGASKDVHTEPQKQIKQGAEVKESSPATSEPKSKKRRK